MIEIVGAPGPDWKILQTQPESSVALRIDPGFLHIWLNEKHYEVETRKYLTEQEGELYFPKRARFEKTVTLVVIQLKTNITSRGK